MKNYQILIRPFGVRAVLIEWPQRIEEEILDDIILFSGCLKSEYLNIPEWEIIASYNSITLVNHKNPIAFNYIKKQIKEWYSDKGNAKGQKKFLWRLPVCYDLDFGIDLLEISNKLNKSIDEIIAIHTATQYIVYGIGFLPGFMYLGGVPTNIEVARKQQPRLKVKKGAVGLAGKQTGIYPQESPGGWNIIGNCSVPMFNAKKDNPCFVNVGDKVQFYAIERAEYDLHKIEEEVGIYKLEKIELDA